MLPWYDVALHFCYAYVEPQHFILDVILPWYDAALHFCYAYVEPQHYTSKYLVWCCLTFLLRIRKTAKIPPFSWSDLFASEKVRAPTLCELYTPEYIHMRLPSCAVMCSHVQSCAGLLIAGTKLCVCYPHQTVHSTRHPAHLSILYQCCINSVSIVYQYCINSVSIVSVPILERCKLCGRKTKTQQRR